MKHLALILMVKKFCSLLSLWGFCVFLSGLPSVICISLAEWPITSSPLFLIAQFHNARWQICFFKSHPYICFWLCLDCFIEQVQIAEAMDILGNTCLSKNSFLGNRNSEQNVGMNRYLKVLHTEKENNKLTEEATSGQWSGDI